MKVESLIKSLSFVTCPDIVAIVEKRFNLDFEDFTSKSICSLLFNYFSQKVWSDIIKFLLKNKRSPQILLLLFFSFLRLKNLEITKCKRVDDFEAVLKGKQVDLEELFKTTLKLANVQKYKVIFRSIEDEEVKETDRMKYLLHQQEKIEEKIEELNS